MNSKFSIKRRNLLIKSGFTALAAQLPTDLTFAKTIANKFKLENIDEQIINEVKNLSSGRNVTLTILQPKGSLENVKPVGDTFSKSTGIQVNYIEASLDEINAKILAQTLSNETYFDISLPATFGIPDLIEAGSLCNLDDFANKYEPKNFKNNMLYPIGDSYKGKFYGYQTDGDTYLMFYNKALLEDKTEKNNFENKYGYPLVIPETWEQLDQMIKFFYRPENNMYGGALYRNKDYIAWEWWIRFHAKGYFPFNNELKPQINNTAGIQALNELINTSNYLYPHSKANGLFENWEAYSKGNIFCNIGWGGTQKYLNGKESKIRENLAFGPMPGGIVKNKLINTPYFNWGWNYTVSSFSNEPEIAYLFTLYACSPKMSTMAVKFPDGYFDPFRSEHYQNPEIQKTYSKSFLAAHKSSMENSIPDLYLSGQGEYWDVLKENIDLANRKKITVQLALDSTVHSWNKITSHHGRNSQLEQWLYLKSQYPNSAKTYFD